MLSSEKIDLTFFDIYADPSLNVLASGPYALVFASFVPFYLDIPVSTRFRVLSLHFSDKTFIYIAGLQVYNENFYFLILTLRVQSVLMFSKHSCSFFSLCGKDHYCLEYVEFLLVAFIV